MVPMASLMKTLKGVFKNVKGLRADIVIGPYDVFKKDYEILLVDEAHRLKRRRSLTSYVAHDINDLQLNLGSEATELD